MFKHKTKINPSFTTSKFGFRRGLNYTGILLCLINPLLTNGLSHPYHLDESTFIFRDIKSIFFSFLFHFSMNFMPANRIAPDGTPHFVASHLGLLCLHMSHKMDDRLIWVLVWV